jgi:hypothetical protein
MTDRRDDVAKLAQGALSVAAGLADEVRSMARAGTDALTARMELVRREEFDALFELVQRTAERVEALEARLAVVQSDEADPPTAWAPAPPTTGGEGSN